jgi:hypothetical protein
MKAIAATPTAVPVKNVRPRENLCSLALETKFLSTSNGSPLQSFDWPFRYLTFETRSEYEESVLEIVVPSIVLAEGPMLSPSPTRPLSVRSNNKWLPVAGAAGAGV